MSIKEKVSQDAPTRVPVKVCIKWLDCKRTEHQEDSDVCQANNVLGRRVFTNSKSLYEIKVCLCM